MVKRLLFALLALVTAQAAIAQNQKPPDVPTPVLQSVTYTSGVTKNKLGATGTATTPDTPPWFASMPADIPTTNRTNWLLTGQVTNGTFEDFTCSTPVCEAKFRSHLSDSHVLYDDPIRNYGEPGTSHCHNFFGNRSTNAFSTFATLRARNESNSAGGRLNGTGYWAPCVVKTNPFADGKNYVVRMPLAALYYVNSNAVAPWLVSLPFGLRYVGGVNMDDPEDTTRRRSVVVANAQPGTSGRYTYHGNGFNGWQCIDGDGVQASPTLVPHLKNTDGTDPWGGTCKVGTGANAGRAAIVIADFDGPSCWDGINPWTPGGYNHVRYKVRDTQLNDTVGEYACPNGWYHIPSIRLELNFTSTGWTDYQNWRLSSDDALQNKLNALPACTTDATGAYANAPCATRSAGGPLGAYWNGTSYVVANGASFHTDWFGAWDGLTMKTWEANCVGVRNLYDGNGNITTTTGSPIPSTAHTCSSSTIASGTIMKTGAPPDSSHNPIIDMTLRRLPPSSAGNMFRIRTVNPSGMKDHTVH